MKKRKNKWEPPIQQPGGEVLSCISSVCMAWMGGNIYSDEAICRIGEIISQEQAEWFDGVLESCGWTRVKDEHE